MEALQLSEEYDKGHIISVIKIDLLLLLIILVDLYFK